MYAERVVEAENAREAVVKFREKIERDEVIWEKSDEGLRSESERGQHG